VQLHEGEDVGVQIAVADVKKKLRGRCRRLVKQNSKTNEFVSYESLATWPGAKANRKARCNSATKASKRLPSGVWRQKPAKKQREILG
jgi:hypothetical protein